MSGAQTLPPVAGSVLADAVDALSPRLRKRLDDTVAKAAAWEVSVAGDGVTGGGSDTVTVTVTVDDDTRVVLTVRDGGVRSGDDAVCSCLLAPACLHRAAVLGIAPAMEDTAPVAAEAVTDASTHVDAAPIEDGSVSAEQRDAAEALRSSAEELIDVGLVGSGLATEATLRRAVHAARAVGLHRLAATGGRVAAQLRAYRTRGQDHALAAYTDELRTLMEIARALTTTTDPARLAALRGTARRQHDRQGGMRLIGFFSEPVIAGSGMAGVVTCTVDADGTLWSVPAVTPGGPAQVENAYQGPVGLGGAALSHTELVRAGLIVSGASASPDGSLSHGAGVRAVRASGGSWWEAPIDAHFAVPLSAVHDGTSDKATPAAEARPATAAHSQFSRVFSTPERVGDDVLFCEAVILPASVTGVIRGAKPGDVPISLDGRIALLRSASDHRALAYVDNLRVLSLAVGLRLRLAARPDRIRGAVLYPIAVSPDPAQNALHLPESWRGRICLGVDRLHDSMVVAAATADDAHGTPGLPDQPLDLPADTTSGIPIHHLRSAVERTAAGGRRAARFAASRDDARRLRAAGMPQAAAVLEHLSTAASARERDDYGRAITPAMSAFADTWLAVALFEAAASSQLAVAAWSRASD